MLESDSNRLRDLALYGAKSISISNYYATKLVDLKLELTLQYIQLWTFAYGY